MTWTLRVFPGGIPAQAAPLCLSSALGREAFLSGSQLVVQGAGRGGEWGEVGTFAAGGVTAGCLGAQSPPPGSDVLRGES